MTNTASELVKAQDHHSAGRLEAADEIYRRIYEKNQDDAEACYGLGVIRLQKSEFAQAAEFLGRASRLEPETAEFSANFAEALQGLGRQEEALQNYFRAAQAAADDAEFLLLVCEKLIALQRPDAALQALAEAPRTPPVLMCIAQAQSALNDHGGAIETLKQAASADQQNPAVWRALSTACALRRNYLGAIEAYNVYLQLKAPTPADHLAHADLLLMARQPEAARTALTRFAESNLEHVEYHLLVAKCARLDGDTESAREHLLKAAALQPTNGEVRQLLLESEPAGSAAEYAEQTAALAKQQHLSLRDRILLLLTAGRAYEKAGENQLAFEHLAAGNDLQQADAVERGVAYDAAETEAYAQLVSEVFATDTASATGSNKQPIFILGMPRSGTTLLERILDGLEGVSAGGENETLEFFSNQYYWDRKHGRAKSLQEMTAADWNRLADEYWLRSGRRKTRATDKMPNNFWHIGFIAAMFPGAPLIHLRRDPRDVCLSIYSRMFPDGHRYASDLSAIAHYYSMSEQIMTFWHERLPGRILSVDYEAIIEDPEVRTQEIANFCGLEWKAECLDFHQRTDASYTFSELQVREPLNSRGVDAWRRYEKQLQPLVNRLIQYDLLSDDA